MLSVYGVAVESWRTTTADDAKAAVVEAYRVWLRARLDEYRRVMGGEP